MSIGSAVKAMAEIESGLAQIQQAADVQHGRLSFACVPTVSSTRLPQILTTFARRFPGITVHVRDHGKVASTKGATGKLTILAGAEKTEVALAPAGEDRMEAKGSFKVAAGTRIVATINLAGKKPANVRFALK